MFPIEVTPSSSQSVTTATSHQLVSGLAVDNGPFISSSIQVPRYQPHQLYPTRLRLKTKTAALPDQSSHALSKPNLPFAPCTARVPYTRTYAARRYFLAIQPTSRAGQTADLANARHASADFREPLVPGRAQMCTRLVSNTEHNVWNM